MIEIGGTRYLNTTELSKLLGITSARVRHWRTEGREHCPFIKLGPMVWYPEDEALAFASTYRNPNAA